MLKRALGSIPEVATVKPQPIVKRITDHVMGRMRETLMLLLEDTLILHEGSDCKGANLSASNTLNALTTECPEQVSLELSTSVFRAFGAPDRLGWRGVILGNLEC